MIQVTITTHYNKSNIIQVPMNQKTILTKISIIPPNGMIILLSVKIHEFQPNGDMHAWMIYMELEGMHGNQLKKRV